jgi:hypothetical protein
MDKSSSGLLYIAKKPNGNRDATFFMVHRAPEIRRPQDIVPLVKYVSNRRTH